MEGLANIEFYGPIISVLAAAVVSLALYVRALVQDAKTTAERHAEKLEALAESRAQEAREMVDTLLSLQATRAEEQRALNAALNAVESTMKSVESAVSRFHDRAFDHLINTDKKT